MTLFWNGCSTCLQEAPERKDVTKTGILGNLIRHKLLLWTSGGN